MEVQEKAVLVFGGTAEGRRLSEYLEEKRIRHTVCVATEYGEEVLTHRREYTQVRQGRLTAQEMEELIKGGGYAAVVDATHPYAAVVSQNVRKACAACRMKYLRYLRPGSAKLAEEELRSDDGKARSFLSSTDEAQQCIYVNSAAEAAAYLEKRDGKIFLTTGSKELSVFTETVSDRSRLFARVLPSAEVIASCRALGLEGRQLCAMQGPFSEEINTAMLRQTGAAYLVTKDTGITGGFPEKERAAKACGVQMVIIRRPEDQGLCWEELTAQLEQVLSAEKRHADEEKAAHEEANAQSRADDAATVGRKLEGKAEIASDIEKTCRKEKQEQVQTKRVISCIGIGMGGPETMTLGAKEALCRADIVFGAGRMLETAKQVLPVYIAPECLAAGRIKTAGSPGAQAEKTGTAGSLGAQAERIETAGCPGAQTEKTAPGRPLLVEEYRAAQIREYLDAHPQYRSAAVLFSGDIGFYSGADSLRRVFEGEEVCYYCGISSVVYFASKIPTAWQDVRLLSAHGRNVNLVGYVKRYPKVMALSGTAKEVEGICRELLDYGLSDVNVTVGSNLSYPQERIEAGPPEKFLHCETQGLHILMIQNPQTEARITPGIPDERFVRGRVPMTKEEIRTLSVAKLQLTEASVVYDVGAGTGSVAVECALLCTAGRVYAIERNSEGTALIRENSRKFGAANLEVIEGTAPEALRDLPAPTHAFIGGSSGNMKQIIELLLEKNPDVRIVINTIALESIAEALSVVKELGRNDADIVQVAAAKSKLLGRYHMMQALNPIYVISFGGNSRCRSENKEQNK